MKRPFSFALALMTCMIFFSGSCGVGDSGQAVNLTEAPRMAETPMDSVATWRTFQYCLDYLRYFLPMSCGASLDRLHRFRNAEAAQTERNMREPYEANTKIAEVINDPALGDYGRLIFPVNTGYYSGDTLGELRLTWYSNVNPDKTVEIANYIKNHAKAGNPIFFDIYTDEEKTADPAKENTGLFFFKGNPGEKFAICNAGGGFAYVGAMHDSFPLALELSKKGYNAFALIYRPGTETACEDLARAISFIFENADELEVSTDSYSLWGGSAGARMAANLGSYGAAVYGSDDLPRPATVVMQYTGHSDYTKNDPPTFAVVGESDGIANWRTMEQRINNLKSAGIDTEFHHYPNLSHGFGLGIGTAAEGWVDDAAAFWEKHSEGSEIE